jgi:flagellar biosynthesis protein FlhG
MYTVFNKGSTAWEYLEKMRKGGSGAHRLYIPRMLPEIKDLDPVSYDKFMDRLNRLHPRLIMNMIEDPKDGEVAMKIRRSCEEYLDLKIEHLGVIYRDTLQDRALSSRLPIVLYKPQSVLAQGIYRVADKVLQSEEGKRVLETGEIEASFQEAGVEAEIDFEAKIDYVEDLLHSGALTQGDMIETVKSQQFEIAKLRKENNFLKLKLSQAIARGFES